VYSVGLKGGLGLTDAFSSLPIAAGGVTLTSGSKDYVIGPTFEIRLPFHLSVEADALYRPLHYNLWTSTQGSAQGNTISNWEIPIVAKYHFHAPVVKPYLEAGPSFRALGNLGYTLSSDDERLSDKGFTLGAGVDFKIPLVRISPEIRFTHWGSDSNVPAGGPSTNQNQAEFLVGVSF
jgi:outer membrane protein W